MLSACKWYPSTTRRILSRATPWDDGHQPSRCGRDSQAYQRWVPILLVLSEHKYVRAKGCTIFLGSFLLCVQRRMPGGPTNLGLRMKYSLRDPFSCTQYTPTDVSFTNTGTFRVGSLPMFPNQSEETPLAASTPTRKNAIC